MSISIIGVDPGGTTGVALLQLRPGIDGTMRYCLPKAFQVQGLGDKAEEPIARIQSEFKPLFAQAQRGRRQIRFAVEAFLVGTRASRSNVPAAGDLARKLIGQLHLLAMELDAGIVERSASQVKAWATDTRLKAATGAAEAEFGRPPASLYDATKRLPHARDAARHALFAAVRDVRWLDPLSRAYSADVVSARPGE